MISELFIYFAGTKVERDFAKIHPTHTLTHNGLDSSGQGSTKQHLSAYNSENRYLFENKY